MKRVLIALAMLIATIYPAAAVTVKWNGPDAFNEAEITFTAFGASELYDIFRYGPAGRLLFVAHADRVHAEACCSTMCGLPVLSWTRTGADSNPESIGGRVPPVVTFAAALVSGIRLVALPNGEDGDPNFFDFNFGGGTEFRFTDATVMPLPAGLPLLGAGLGVLGYLGWRRKRPSAAA